MEIHFDEHESRRPFKSRLPDHLELCEFLYRGEMMTGKYASRFDFAKSSVRALFQPPLKNAPSFAPDLSTIRPLYGLLH
jgi:hypothetical protein